MRFRWKRGICGGRKTVGQAIPTGTVATDGVSIRAPIDTSVGMTVAIGHWIDGSTSQTEFAHGVEEAFFSDAVIDLAELVDIHLEKRSAVAAGELALAAKELNQDLFLDG